MRHTIFRQVDQTNSPGYNIPQANIRAFLRACILVYRPEYSPFGKQFSPTSQVMAMVGNVCAGRLRRSYLVRQQRRICRSQLRGHVVLRFDWRSTLSRRTLASVQYGDRAAPAEVL